MSIIKFNKNINTKVVIQKDLRWENFSFDDGKVFFKGEKDFVKKTFLLSLKKINMTHKK